MKNLLSENMLRFGTKNLSESAQKESIVKSIIQTIKEHGLTNAVRRSLLTEAVVELMADAGAAAALKNLKAQIAKGTKLPGVVMGQYYLKVTSNAETTDQLGTGVMVRGKVGGLHGKGIGGVGTIPVPSYFTNTSGAEGGTLEFPIAGAWTILNFDNSQSPLPATTTEQAAIINAACALYPLVSLNAMLAAHPKKAAYDTAMAAFKASKSAIKPLLTGNAKAFYGIV